MSKVSKPKITEMKRPQEYTKITFKPDLKLFHMEKIDDDLISLLSRRVYDVAGCLRDVKVMLNKERINIRSFKSYVEMFLNALAKNDDEADPTKKPVIVHEIVNDRWEIAFAVSDGSFNQVSFVNSIATTSGGSHVTYIADQIVTKISEIVKKGKVPIRPSQIKNNMFLFVNCLIENPAFTSQTKEQLTTRPSAFGSKCVLTPEFLKKVMKTPILDKVKNIATQNADNEQKKTDGGKNRRIKGVTKLEDANKAGTRDGHKCTLILTEGDSAASLAVAGLAVVGRDYYGVFPLRGKLLNVREATLDQVTKNAEIQAIKQIMGLQHKKHYNSTKDLRYGHIMIMTDQDHDGSHIKGLIINFIESTFPGLLQIPGFLVEFITPIIKVSILRGKKVARVIPFYTIPEYEVWRDTEGKRCTWKQKYYKGLGTSTPEEFRKYFSALDQHWKTFHVLQDEDKPLIDLAFSKKKADDRKDWLRAFKPGTHLDPSISTIPISEFINKELILFSVADNMRSIPSMVDGFKPGQRKILYGCFKRNLKSEIKVVQLAGYVSENTGYHHGEQSLVQTIINLAQDFVGSNNLYILMPNGSFGSRAVGGKDSAAPRYIFTELNTLTKKIFNPADGPLLNYLADDEATVEPEWYLPILPMILVNGAEGIGTGWSTNIPGFNPIDIINNIKRLLNGEEMDEMMPWFRGWTGVIDKLPDNKYRARGLISQVDDTTLEITELPPKMWTQNMRDFLLSSLKDRRGAQSEKAGWIDDFTEEHGTGIRFVIKLSREEMAKTMKEGPYNRFRLVSTINLSNMMAFDSQNRIKKYDSPLQILSEFYYLRLEYYQKRKDFVSNLLRNQLTKLSEQAKFVKLIIEKKLSIANRKKVDIIAELKRLDFPAFDKNNVPTKQTSIEEAAVEIDEEELPEDVEDPRKHFPTFDYLLGMSILSLTKERYERLLRERGVKEEELNILLKKTPKDLWIEDLDDFLDAWETFETEDTERRESVVASRKKGGKKRARKAASDDEFDGDFTTTKKKKKAAAPKKISEIKREPLPFEPPIVKTNSRATAIKKEKTASASASASAEPEETKKTQAAKPKGKRKAIDNEEENDVEIKEEGFSFGKTASIFGTPFKRTKKKDEYDLEPEALFSDLTGGSTSNGTKPTNGSDKKSASSSAAASASAEPEPVKSRFALSISSDDDDDDGIFSNLKKQTAEKKKTTAATMLSAKSKTVPAAETEKDKDAKPKLLQRKLNFQPATKATSPAAAAKPVTAAKPKKKPAAKSNSVLSDDENEDSAAEDEPLVAAPTPKRASRRAAASKPKYVVDFSDEDDGEEEDEEPSIMISSDSE